MRVGSIVAIWTLGMALLVSGCGTKSSPQRPAQHGNELAERDSSMERMAQLNQRMVEEADHQVLVYVQADSVHQYARCSQGAWVTRTRKVTDSEHPRMTEKVHVAMQIYTLGGELLQDIDGMYTIGNGEIPLGIEYALRELYRGESGIIVAPWHAAFGVDGTGNIAPYTNVRIDISIE